MKARSRIALAVVGLGEQSNWIFSNLPKINRSLAYHDIALELLLVGDKREAAVEQKRSRYPYIFKSVEDAFTEGSFPIDLILEYFLERFTHRMKEYRSCIIYDSSATSHHFTNLKHVASRQGEAKKPFCYYFGEKPIVPLDSEHSDILAHYLEHLQYWCNFTELRNPAVMSIIRYIKAQRLKIQELKFWRLGDVGYRQLLHDERQGVTGGSFLDKAVHDLAVAYAFIAASWRDFTPDFEAISPTIQNITAEIRWLMPALLSPSPSKRGEFVTVDGSASTRAEDLAADANAKVSFLLSKVNGDTVPCSFTSSWLGLNKDDERELMDLAHSFNQEPGSWLEEASIKPENMKFGYRRQEARLLYLRCVDASNVEVEICANMLSTSHRHEDGEKLFAWAKIKKNAKINSLRLLQNETGDAFSDIVTHVARDVCRISSRKGVALRFTEDLGSQMSTGVHRLAVLLSTAIRKQIERQGDRLELLEEARRKVVAQLLRPYCLDLFPREEE